MFVDSASLTFKQGCDFLYIFSAPERHDSSVYLVASELAISRHVERELHLNHDIDVNDLTRNGGAVEATLANTAGQTIRRQGFEELAMQRGLWLEDGRWTTRAAIVDLSQTSEFWNRVVTGAMPCLLQRSRLFDLVAQRDVVIEELFAVQGFAHPDLLGDVMPDEFPFVNLQLPEGSLRQLLGNSMHLAAVGASLLFMVAATEKSLSPCM